MSVVRISLPGVPAPSSPYAPATIVGNLVFVSGQGPIDLATGEVVGTTIREQTLVVMNNIKAILDTVGSRMDQIAKVSVFLRDIEDFATFNETYRQFFSNGFPARTTVQAADMTPKGALLEVDCIASIE